MQEAAAEKIFTRDFNLVFLSQLAMSFVYNILIPTLPIYLSRSGSTEVEIGILIGSFSISSLILRPFVGRALLRIPEKTFMIAGALLYALPSAAYLVAPLFWPFLVVRVFHGIGMALFYTASITLVANISPEAHRGQSLGYFYLAFNLAFAVGSYLGMVIINNLNFTSLFLICTGLALGSLSISSRLKTREPDPIEASCTGEQSFLNWEALPPTIMTFFTHVGWGALTAFFPLYAVDHGMANPGLFFGASAIILILARALGGKILDLYSREKVILPCLITYTLSMLLLAFSRSVPMFLLVAVIYGAGSAFLAPALVAYAVDLGGSQRGTTMGTFMAVGDLGMGLGPVIMGVVLKLTNYPIMFLCLALTGLMNLGYFHFFVRKRG